MSVPVPPLAGLGSAPPADTDPGTSAPPSSCIEVTGSTAASTTMGAAGIQPGVLEALVGDDAEAISEILAIYLDSMESAVPELQRGLRDRDTRAIAAAAHRMRSPSLSVGAVSLSVICHALERDAMAGDRARLDELWRAFAAEFANVQCSAIGIRARLQRRSNL